MVTTRRRITNERDRFGGYGISPSAKSPYGDDEGNPAISERGNFFSLRTVTEEPSRDTETAERYSSDSVSFTDYEQKTENTTAPVIEYSQRPYMGGYEYAKPVKTPTRAKRTRKRESEDVMPSIRTRAYAARESEEETAQGEKSKMSTKTKVALVAYIAVVLVLAIAVIATGLAISSANAASASLESEIALKSSRLAEIDSEIAEYTNLDRVIGAAYNNGMEKADSAKEVDLLPTSEPTQYQGRTNWFDKLGDFLSGIVGG